MRNSIKILALITLGLFLFGFIACVTDIGGAGILIFFYNIHNNRSKYLQKDKTKC